MYEVRALDEVARIESPPVALIPASVIGPPHARGSVEPGRDRCRAGVEDRSIAVDPRGRDLLLALGDASLCS